MSNAHAPARRLSRSWLATDQTRVRAALLIGLALSALAVGLTLTGTPVTVTRTNAVALEAELQRSEGPTAACQPDESLPRGTSAIRPSLAATIGPRVSVEVFSGERPLTGGVRGSGWTSTSVTVPVRPLAHTASNVTVCFALARSRVHIALLGAPSEPAVAAISPDGRPLPGRMRIEYLRRVRGSWWSRAVSVARRMGLGHAWAGTWIALLVLALMLVLALLASWLVVREIGPSRAANARGEGREACSRRGKLVRAAPPAALACALVACLNAVCWSLITPPFQVPDEPSHVAYVQVLFAQGRLPVEGLTGFSPELRVAIRDLHSSEVNFAPQQRSLASEAQQRQLERDLAGALSRRGAGGAGTATQEPPLYYGLQAIPYALGSGGSLLERLELMRLLSALMAAVTALFAYLLVREALPGSRWAWTVGGLAVALFPLLGFISGGVNPDAMMFAVCAALYYCLARAFRRGLTPRLAMFTGVLTAIGFLTKLNFVGFVPGVLLGLVLLCVRATSSGEHDTQPGKRTVYRTTAIAIAVSLSPVALYALVNLLSNHPGLGAASGTLTGVHRSPSGEISYIWQFYLPRLPGMHSYFPGILTPRQLWFNGLVGLYGWGDTLFPGWAYDVALIPAALIFALCVREAVRGRMALRRRTGELATYLVSGAGVAILVGDQSYVADVLHGAEAFWEPRYLLPMLALWGLVAALAARGAGRRWGPSVGALLVTLFLAHDVLSQLQLIARYYG